MSTRGRHTDSKKSEFYKQLFSHEVSSSNRRPSDNDSFKIAPFVFKQTYSLSSLHGAEPETRDIRQPQAQAFALAQTSPIWPLSKAQGFSSFHFGSGQTSMAYGHFHFNPDQPKRMSLKEQREFGGAAMAGLELGAEARRRRRRLRDADSGEGAATADFTHTLVSDAAAVTQQAAPRMLREARTTRPGLSAASPAALAFPALSRDDPALQALVESTDVLDHRRTELLGELGVVKRRLEKFKEPPPSAHQAAFGRPL